MANGMATGEVRPREQGQDEALMRAGLGTLSPAELMLRARRGDWARVDRELRRRGPAATREALASLPRDTAAMASSPVRLDGRTLHETVASLGLVITDDGREHIVGEVDGRRLRRGDEAALWCWLFDSGRITPQKEECRG
ncbi:hypothetical protein COSO111634_16410 [Corallococcus soli]